jgi:hypothetical protein
MARRRLILISLAAALALVAAGYTALWLYAAHAVRAGLVQWTDAARAAGMTVEYGTPELSGFPLALRFAVARPHVVGPHELWHWSGDGIEAEVWPWAFRTVRVRPIARQEASFPVAGGVETLATDDETAEIVASFDGSGRFTYGTVDAARLTIARSLARPGAAPAPSPAPITVAGLHMALGVPTLPDMPAAGPDLPASLALTFAADDLDLPEAAASPFGSHVRQIAIELQIMGKIAPGPPRAALAAWRDAGGTLELRRLDLDWGPLDVSGNATVALDGNLQPEGAAGTTIRGYDATIKALVARGLIGPQTGVFLSAALTLMAEGQHNRDPSALSVPLSIQHQRLFVGPFGLMNVPAIDWPQ